MRWTFMFVFGLWTLVHEPSVVHTKVYQVRRHTIVKRRVACYGVLGCFSTEGPFRNIPYRPLNLLPATRKSIGTKFSLFTHRSKIHADSLVADDASTVSKSLFSAAKETKMIVHGFIETGKEKWLHDMKDKLLLAGDYNVIIIDWGGGSFLPYTQATGNTRLVGAETALLIQTICNVTGARPESFHIIGHSLGAHLAGYAGERLKSLGRITGMDPADPYFSYTDKVVRLDPTDAKLVDVIHTDADHILSTLKASGGFGIEQPVGHLDFYPNGGSQQPGCEHTLSMMSEVFTAGLYNGGKKFFVCDHTRAHELFTDSVTSTCPFIGFKCNSYDEYKSGKCSSCGKWGCPQMGLNADKFPLAQLTGINNKFYLDTNGASPFCSYHYEVKVQVSQNMGAASERGTISLVLTGTKGTSEKIPLTESNVDISPGDVLVSKYSTSRDIGTLQSIAVSWVHSANLLKPWEWNLFGMRNPKISVWQIEVFAPAMNQRYSFCSKGEFLENNSPKTYNVASRSCSAQSNIVIG
ncbi:pancreatic triacylglycerol lipase [Lingula anatina]|uniref:Pancreatic triacylglycerol lipase n=1 Tax=Lingula anatina TaxID=7574 RepID=A0A1S3II26_LINAN|nr:pancreatic triacylglycerol lipase [Lingula anatina]|eukprot:XP_013397778.1 pancreatic triacylglycerol lipase [Lingula anatina]